MYIFLLSAIVFFVWILYVYNTIISIFSYKKKGKNSNKSLSEKTFQILIPCHNEEEVIYENLNSIASNNYDRNNYEIVVVADNCSDGTVDVCRNFKKKNPSINLTILEIKGGSKPKALNLAIRELKKLKKWNKEYIMTLDSDNLLSPTFLKTFSDEHELEPILQCRIKSKNANSFIARGFASSFNRGALGSQLARNNAGLSAGLSGTGFSVKRDVWDEIKFENCDTLTEDLEFCMMAIIKGYKVKYIENEYVLNQNVNTFKEAYHQRMRWCRGHMQVSVKLTKDIVIEFLRRPRFQLIDSLIVLNCPPRAIINIISLFLTIFNPINVPLLIRIIGLLIFIYNIFFMMRCDEFQLSYLSASIFYTMNMHFIIVIGALTYKNKVWIKTPHKKINK